MKANPKREVPKSVAKVHGGMKKSKAYIVPHKRSGPVDNLLSLPLKISADEFI